MERDRKFKIQIGSCNQEITIKRVRKYNENEKSLSKAIWRPPSLSELTPMVLNTGLTHLDLEASIL